MLVYSFILEGLWDKTTLEEIDLRLGCRAKRSRFELIF
jgi:hypothetical protein